VISLTNWASSSPIFFGRREIKSGVSGTRIQNWDPLWAGLFQKTGTNPPPENHRHGVDFEGGQGHVRCFARNVGKVRSSSSDGLVTPFEYRPARGRLTPVMCNGLSLRKGDQGSLTWLCKAARASILPAETVTGVVHSCAFSRASAWVRNGPGPAIRRRPTLRQTEFLEGLRTA
jgi:hypothetical protein